MEYKSIFDIYYKLKGDLRKFLINEYRYYPEAVKFEFNINAATRTITLIWHDCVISRNLTPNIKEYPQSDYKWDITFPIDANSEYIIIDFIDAFNDVFRWSYTLDLID